LSRCRSAPLLGLGALDLGFGLLQLGLLRFERALLSRRIEGDDYFAGRDFGAVDGQVHDLEIRSSRRRSQHDRPHGPNLPSQLQEIDERRPRDEPGGQ